MKLKFPIRKYSFYLKIKGAVQCKYLDVKVVQNGVHFIKMNWIIIIITVHLFKKKRLDEDVSNNKSAKK